MGKKKDKKKETASWPFPPAEKQYARKSYDNIPERPDRPSMLGAASTRDIVVELILRLDTKVGINNINPELFTELCKKAEPYRFRQQDAEATR